MKLLSIALFLGIWASASQAWAMETTYYGCDEMSEIMLRRGFMVLTSQGGAPTPFFHDAVDVTCAKRARPATAFVKSQDSPDGNCYVGLTCPEYCKDEDNVHCLGINYFPSTDDGYMSGRSFGDKMLCAYMRLCN